MHPWAREGLVVSAVLKCLTGPNDVKRPRSDLGDDGSPTREASFWSCRPASLGDGLAVDAWVVREHVFKQPVERQSGGGSPDGVKLAGTAYRRDDFTLEAFFDYWHNVHTPISGRFPGSADTSSRRSGAGPRRVEPRRPARAVVAGRADLRGLGATHRSRLRPGTTCRGTRRRRGPSGCCASRCSFPRRRPARARSTPQMPELRPDILRTPHSGIRRMLSSLRRWRRPSCW